MRNEQSRLRTWFAAVLAVLAGVLLLIVSHQVAWPWAQRLLNDLGSITIAAVALMMVFDYWQKDAFFAEFFRTAKGSAEIKASGLIGFTEVFQEQIDWDDLFLNSTRLDILFAYSSTWRSNHLHRLQKLLSHEKTRLRVILPDPANDIVIAELALRFNYTPTALREKIADATSYFERLNNPPKGSVEIYYLGRTLTHSFYRFNTTAVIALYTHQIGRERVPTFLAKRGGSLYEFIRIEAHSMIDDGPRKGHVRRVFPP